MLLCCVISYQLTRYVGAGSSESLMIVEALAEVTSHPDDNIAAITFNFWHRLSLALTTRYISDFKWSIFLRWQRKFFNLELPFVFESLSTLVASFDIMCSLTPPFTRVQSKSSAGKLLGTCLQILLCFCTLFRERLEQHASAEGEAAVDVERERRLAIFRPTFELLVSLVGHNTFPCNGLPAIIAFCIWSFSISELLLLLHGTESWHPILTIPG